MHHPMTRRTVGEIEVLEAWRSSKKLVPVGRHFIQSCHTICPVNGKRRKLWHTLFRTCHNFFDPPLLEGRIEWIACRIVHWQQQEYSSIASAKVKTVLRENRHRLDEAVDGTKRSADDSIKADRRIMLSDVVRRNFPHISQSRLLLNLFRRLKDGHLMLILRDKEIAARPIARVDAKFTFEMKKFLSRSKRELYADFRSELAAKSTRGFRCTSGSGLFARIDDEDIRFTSDGKVIRNACAHDTTTNDEMIDGSHSLSDPGSSTGGNYFVKDSRDA